MELHSHQERINEETRKSLFALHPVAQKILDGSEGIKSTLKDLGPDAPSEKIFATSEALHRNLYETLGRLKDDGKLSAGVAEQIWYRVAALSLQDNTFIETQRIISVSARPEFANQLIGVQITSDSDFDAHIEKSSIDRCWTLRISFGLFAAINHALMMLFDPATQQRSQTTTIESVQKRFDRIVCGERPRRHEQFPTDALALIENIGSLAKWFIISHELGHVMHDAIGDDRGGSDDEYVADEFGWLLYYGQCMMRCPPFDALYAAGKIRTNEDRWSWTHTQIPGILTMSDAERQIAVESFLSTTMSADDRTTAASINIQMHFAPFLIFRTIEYLERSIIRCTGQLPRTHPRSIKRRRNILSKIPADLRKQIERHSLAMLDARLPSPTARRRFKLWPLSKF